MAKKKGSSEMARDWKAMEEAMDADRKKNPPVGSPAWWDSQAKDKKR